MLRKTYTQGFVIIWGLICFSILTNIGHNVFLLANFCTTRTTKKEKKEKRKCEVYKGLLLSPILGVMFFFWPNFAPQQQKKKKKNVMCIKRL